MSYPYDPQTREYVARLLYQALPAMYRAQDSAPKGRDELRRFLEVLAAPLATLRQSIEELHADLFIDTANDWVVPYLADMVGTTLIFPDADKNRRDVRETVGWRKRKGTPSMLQELASQLAEQQVVTREGWKLVHMTQDLDLPRPTRALPDLRDPRIAETVSGPGVTSPHLVDVRRISKTHGKFHPLHVFHWAHPTLLFDLRKGVPAELTEVGDPDLRYAFHPAGVFQQLRARRVSERDPLLTDRVPPMHFAADPGAWFGAEGRFSVSICGLAAGLAEPSDEARSESLVPASPVLLEGTVDIDVLEHDRRRFYGPIVVELGAAELQNPLPDAPVDFFPCATVELSDQAAPAASFIANPPASHDVVMVRLVPGGGAGARFFPGATVELESDASAAWLAAEDAGLASDGFLRGALFVTLPPTYVDGQRFFYLAADGSVIDAQTTGSGAVDVQILDDGGGRLLDRDRVLIAGPGAAWPPLSATRDPQAWPYVPQAPGRGPVILHGGRALANGAGFPVLAAGPIRSLVFALSYEDGAARAYRPFVRLAWTATDPATADWTALDDSGLAVADADGRFAELADFRDQDRSGLRLAVRFETAVNDVILTPSEVAWTSDDGRTVLLHLPQLETQNGSPIAAWATDAAFVGISDAFYVGVDGSTWSETTGDNGRASWGAIAPLAEPPALRRRRVAWRLLCPWKNENGTPHAATRPGWLDMDVEHGLFSLAAAEPPQALPPGPDGLAPPSVTVRYQQGYSAEMGALPAPREPFLDRRLARPTRLVTRSGHLHRNAAADLHDIPRYRSLGAALAAAVDAEEVIQFEDSSTYPGETLVWPGTIRHLTIQAAESERPWVQVTGWNVAAGAQYDHLSLLGFALGAAGLGDLELPPAAHTAVELLTVTEVGNRLVFPAHSEGSRVLVRHVLAAGLHLPGPGSLTVHDAVVDSGRGLGNPALVTDSGHLVLDRVTVFGTTRARVLDASEVYFEDTVEVDDRFEGCVRYSRVTSDSVLPRVHRVVEDIAADFVAVERHDPAHGRLTESTPTAVLHGAEDGGEIGAFHDIRLAQIYAALLHRLLEYTPAGLATGVLRSD